MSGHRAELLRIPLRALRRAGVAWAVAMVLIIGATVAFWPAFQGATALNDVFNQLPGGLVQALGLEDFVSPAGYLRGNLYELLIPLLLGAAAVVMASGQTAGEEDSGRLELYLAQPISRIGTLLGRILAVLGWMVLVGVVVFVAQVVFNRLVDLEIGTDLLVATIALCTLLGLLHGSLAIALAGWLPRPSLVIGISLVVLFAGYLVGALFPLSDVLAPWRHISPWNWALGGDPLVHPSEAWRYVALAVPTVLLAIIGLFGFARRDIRAA
ncbi:MAG TPA: ABC transporter permease subunit [Candidatus Limnocylindrales bacterium]|nr:ABC transporter permease subunit [Candidatus Limnocylindrales bacterium]